MLSKQTNSSNPINHLGSRKPLTLYHRLWRINHNVVDFNDVLLLVCDYEQNKKKSKG